jgi:protein-arginine kinase activator protein McsA
MFTHAELLEFEEAASVRDEISRLKDRVLKM